MTFRLVLRVGGRLGAADRRATTRDGRMFQTSANQSHVILPMTEPFARAGDDASMTGRRDFLAWPTSFQRRARVATFHVQKCPWCDLEMIVRWLSRSALIRLSPPSSSAVAPPATPACRTVWPRTRAF
jgi:hypothetical protein